MEQRIYIDLDDVLCETGRAFTEVLNRHFGKTVAFEEIVDFDLSRSFGLARDELEDFMEQAHLPDVLGDLEPMDGALEAIEHWYRAGYEIVVVTGRPPATREVSAGWLARHGVEHQELLFVDKYGRRREVDGFDGALPLAELDASDFCLAVEDAPHVGQRLVEELGMTVSLLERPWNRQADLEHLEIDRRLVRCENWRAVIENFPRP